MPLGHWPGLLPFLEQTCVSQQAVHREVGIYILYTVLENIVEGFQEHMSALFKLFRDLLQDPESGEVRVTAVRALGVLAQYISSEEKAEIRAFQELLPFMITVVQQSIEAGDEQNSRHLVDVFETLLILVRTANVIGTQHLISYCRKFLC